MIFTASVAGADAFKLQAFRADDLYPRKSEHWNTVRPLELPLDWLPEIHEVCNEMQIELMVSAFSEEMVDAVDPYVKRHKVASLELTDLSLLRHIASKGKPVILSTGAATKEQVQAAISALGTIPLTVLHCVTAYPTPPEDMNLQAMMTVSLCSRGWLPYGLSDHTLDPIVAPVMAVALGASVIEKHMTLSRELQGPDHAYAITPEEMTKMVQAVRTAECMMGDGEKRVMASEKQWTGLQHRDGGVRGA